MMEHVEPADVPLAGNIISVMLSMFTFGVLAVCLTRRLQTIKMWKKIPLASWLLLIIYVDSTLFVFASAVVTRGFGINESEGICEGAILLCLICYMTTKVLIYYFLVERAYIIRGSRLPRMKTKLYVFNCFGMILPYLVIIVMNFVWRISYINDSGVCIIGMQKIAMMPLITFDVVLNVYLTILFIIPLRQLYSYQHNTNRALRTMALRTFLGSCATLTSSVVNLTILMVLKGEPGWICLMCCNADILFCVLVLHWISQRESSNISSSNGSQPTANNVNGSAHGTMNRDGLASPGQWRESISKRVDGVLQEPKKVHGGTITTEIKSMPHGMHDEDPDNIVELHQIRVHTQQIQEIEIDGRSESELVGNASGFGGRSSSSEKMV